MPAFFAPAWDYLQTWEDPSGLGKVTVDSGGVTRWGISSRAYPDLDVRNLLKEDAAAIARRDYFMPIHGYEIASQRIASKLFDCAFNMGVKTAVRLCQQALRLAAAQCDGVIGPKTLEALQSANPDAFLGYFIDEIERHYVAIAEKRPDEAQYLKGWLRRGKALPPADPDAQPQAQAAAAS